MSDIVKIDDELITAEGFIKILKLNGRFDELIEEVLKDKLTIHAARRAGIEVTPEEIQERADQFRRIHGLHRAKDTNDYLDTVGVTLDDFEGFITDMLYHDKMMDQVCNPQAIEDFFGLHSPKFEAVEISHIVVDSEGKARELMSILSEEPDLFSEMAREHSISDTRDSGGQIGKVMRGSLAPEVESKVFNAQVGVPLGSFPMGDGSHHEIFTVTARHPATLDEETSSEIRRQVRDDWLVARAREHRIEAL